MDVAPSSAEPNALFALWLLYDSNIYSALENDVGRGDLAQGGVGYEVDRLAFHNHPLVRSGV
jgi:hypothetical protein